MPEIDGVELLRKFAAERVTAPIVLMSGVDDKLLRAVGDLGAELGLNMRGILTKPIRLETFRYDARGKRGIQRLELVEELRTGIAGGAELDAPLPADRAAAVRDLVAVEALVRWNHPARGLVPPISSFRSPKRTA